MFLCSVTHGNLSIRLRTLVNSSHIVTVNDLSVYLPLLDECLDIAAGVTKTHCHYTHYPQPVLTWQLEPGPACCVMTYSRQATLLATALLCGSRERDLLYCTLYCTVHCTHCTHAESTLTAAMANNNMTIVGEDRGIHPAENRTNHLCLDNH